MKHFIIALVAAALVSVGGVSAHAQEYDWKFQSSEPAGSIFIPIQQEWAERVSAASNGRVNIEIVPVGSIVAHNETHDAIGAGILGGHISSTEYIAGKDASFSLIANPVGGWGSPHELFRYMKYGGGHELLNELLHPYGVHAIGVTTSGLEAFVSTKPLSGVADLQGLKMRSPEGLVTETFAAAGAAPVNLPTSEVFTALDKGVVDAADYSAFSVNHSVGLHDIAKHPVYPGFHSMPLLEVSVNKGQWDSMPSDLQQILEFSVDWLAYEQISIIAMADLEAIVEARSQGATVHNWSQEERAKFRAFAREQWAKKAAESADAQRVFDSLTSYMEAQGLLR